MSITRTLLTKLVSLVVIFSILIFVFSDHAENLNGYLDLRAGLLVFITPAFVLSLFLRESIQWRSYFLRAKEVLKVDSNRLYKELQESAHPATGQFGLSYVAKMTDAHPDSMLRYAGNLISAKYRPDEIERLLSQRIQSEDLSWQALGNSLAFLAKMAPYFGMLATVIGMVKLLEQMNDFTKISGSMALAMQGTLYGLVSFTLVYSPLQKWVQGWREDLLRRNDMILRWSSAVSKKVESSLIAEDLRSLRPETSLDQESAWNPSARPALANPAPTPPVGHA